MTLKISPAQLKLLKRMCFGETIKLLRGRDTHAYMDMNETVRVDTVFALLRLGLIYDVQVPEMRWRDSQYKITKDGRACVKSAKARDR